MALPPAPTVEDFDIVLPIFVGIGFLMSVYRLWERARTRRLGWDDTFCTVAILFLIGVVIFFFVSEQPPPSIDHSTWFIAYYGAAVCFDGVTWMARLSLVFTAVRIAAFRRQKLWLLGVAALFMTVFLVLVAQIFWICEPQPGWKTADPPQCDLGQQRSITEICCDITADLILLIVPLRLFLKTSLEWNVRLRLILLFSTCILLTIVCVVHDVYVLLSGGTREVFASMMQVSFALIVCNIPVIGSTLYRVITGKGDPNDSARSGAITGNSTHLTSGLANRLTSRVRTDWTEGGHRKDPVKGIMVRHEVDFDIDETYQMDIMGKVGDVEFDGAESQEPSVLEVETA